MVDSVSKGKVLVDVFGNVSTKNNQNELEQNRSKPNLNIETDDLAINKNMITCNHLYKFNAESLNLKEAKGALVSAVEIDSPADLGQIMPGDVIVSFNREAVIESSDLPPLVGQVAPGGRVPVEIVRDGKIKKLNVIVAALDGDQPITEQSSKVNENGDRLGLIVEDVTKLSMPDDGLNGVVIQYIAPRSAAEMAGLQQGDIIVQLGKIRISNFQ